MDTTTNTPIANGIETMNALPAEAPVYDRLRSMCLMAFHADDISFATLQSCLALAHVVEADITLRNIASVAINREPDGTLHRG